MSFDDNTYELIDRYLKGELSGEELSSFESRMENDEGLKSEVDNQRLVSEAVHLKGLADLKQQMAADLDTMDEKREDHHHRPRGLLVGILFVATLISFVLIIVFGEDKQHKGQEDNAPSTIEESENHSTDVSVSDSAETSSNSGIVAESSVVEIHEDGTILSGPDTLIGQKLDTHLIQIPDSVQVIIKSDSIAESTLIEAPEVAKTNKDTCGSVKMSAKTVARKSDKNEDNGAIIVDMNSAKGGTKPYRFYTIENPDMKSGSGYLTGYTPGSYTVIIMDSKGCADTLDEVTIGESKCISNYRQEFTPDMDDTWEIPVDGEGAIVQIYSKAGLVRTIDIEKHGKLWDGNDNYGKRVATGFYKLRINYRDGSTCIAQVTVYR